jgi:hypothetical protein
MAAAPRKSRQPGAVKLGGGAARKGGGWPRWVLPLLALLVLATLLITSLRGGDDQKITAARAAPTATASAAADSAASGTLTSGVRTLRGNVPNTLTAAVGQKATGRAVKVLSVASGTGFWVGTSKSDRTFVEYGSSVGGNESQPYKPKVGDTVDLSGPVRPAPPDPAQTLRLSAGDAEQLTAQGAYINADDVTAR